MELLLGDRDGCPARRVFLLYLKAATLLLRTFRLNGFIASSKERDKQQEGDDDCRDPRPTTLQLTHDLQKESRLLFRKSSYGSSIHLHKLPN
ncbi:hypothetical protein ABBQ38_008838 [Trebouxia sp. C0009 RCD-2024]